MFDKRTDGMNDQRVMKIRRTVSRAKGAIPLLLALAIGVLVPQGAQAWPTKFTSCTSCHATQDADGVISTFLNGTAGTSISVAPGDTFEVDFYFTNAANSANGYGVGIEAALPSGWVIAPGTSTYAPSGWKAVWDNAAGLGSWSTMFDTSGEYPNSPDGYTIDFGGSLWDADGTGGGKTRNAARDDGNYNGGVLPSDQDLTAETMGADLRITVPAGTPNGTYYVEVEGIGHDGASNSKSHDEQMLTITVAAAGGDVTPPAEVAASLSVAPEYGSFVPGTFTLSEQFSDAESAVTACEYTTDGSTWSPASVSGAGPYTCTATGVTSANGVPLTLQMRATSSGGTSTPVQTLNRTVDAAAPSTTDNAPAGWQASDVTVALTPADGSGSGVATTEYCLDTTNTCTPSVLGASANVTQAAGTFGTQYLRYRSTDNLGNVEATVSVAVQIDKEVPVDGTLTLTPGDSQLALSWGAASEGNGLASPAYTVRRVAGTVPPADCATGTLVYQGNLTTATDTGLTNGSDYAYRVCATDVAGNISSGATATAQPAAVCSSADPTVTITTANQQITSGGGSAVYTVQVTNNDAPACGDTTFSLSVNDSNATDFQASVLATASLLVSPGASNTTTLTVAAVGSPGNGSTDGSSVTSAASGPHGAVTSNTVTTLVNLPRTPAMHYNSGETVHFEFRTANRFSGTPTLTVAQSDSTNVLSAVTMLEVLDGAQWVYTYDWDTTAQAADTYLIQLWDGGDANPIVSSSLTLDKPLAKITLFADPGYTTPTDIFANGDTVYVEVQLPAAETAVQTSDIDNWYGASTATSNTVSQTGTTFRYRFIADFLSAGLADGDWGYVFFQGVDTSTTTLHRPIQRNDAGCGSCTYGVPTVSIVTPNQSVNTDGGTASYTVNVTNNDTVACGATAFDLVAVDSNAGNFDPSVFTVDPLTVSPGLTGTTTLTVTAKATQPNGSTNDTYFYSNADANHALSANSNTATTDINVVDLSAPTVDSFTVPATSTSQTVAVTAFTASDNVGVTGYLITESATAPLAGDPGWSASAPVNYTVSAGDGSYTLYAWVKDAQGNVSTSLSAVVDVDSAAPAVTAFTVPSPQAALTVTLTTFTASDNLGVTGYLVTESAAAPAPGAAGWLGAPPASYSFSADGSYTLYAWAKDAVGNISAAASAPVTVDTSAPSVQSTVPADLATGIALDSDVTVTWTEPVDCGTVSTTSVSSDNPAWTLSSCTGSQATFTTTGQAYLTTYHVTVATSVTDLAGNPMSGVYAFSYQTLAEPCVYNPPTVSIDTPSQNAIVDNDLVAYTITVNNNDTGSCGATTFPLAAVDSNGTDFNASTFGSASLVIAPSSSGTTSLVVSPKSGALNGVSNITFFHTDGTADPNHADSVNSNSVTTTVAVPCDLAPTVSIDTANQGITSDGGSAGYNVTVTNGNALACGSSAFSLVAVDDNGSAFIVPSTFASNPLTVAPGGGSNTTTLTVTAQAGATNGSSNNSYFYTAVNGTIPASSNSNVVTTTLNRPCVRNAPGFSTGVNATVAPGGSTDYTLTVINNDVDCADATFSFGLDSEVESNVGAFTTPSVFSAPSVTVPAGGSSGAVTLTVTGSGAGADGDTLTSTVRLADAANHSGMDQTSVAVTTVKVFNPLIHSSLSTGSSKHAVDGGWGITGGRYGQFTCDTCHQRSSGNIKRIRSVLPSAPDTSKGDFPGAGGAISFLDAEDVNNPAEFGSDDTAPRSSSNRICEVCHSYDATRANGVDRHAYDQAVDANHYDGEDCTKCHRHNSGFSAAGAACNSCHGYPPAPGDGFPYQGVEGKGAHLQHVNHLAALAGVTLDPATDTFGDANVTKVCGACHDMAAVNHETSGGIRNIDFNGANTFQFGPNPPTYNGAVGVSSGTTPKTCSNINCHFQDSPWWE